MKAKRLSTDTDTLISTFGLKKQRDTELLNSWLNASGKLTPLQSELLDKVYASAINRIAGWNEEELKIKFISFLLFIADVEEEGKISSFFERAMSHVWDDFELSVICDCVIATPLGYNTPKTPYFFLQEYKKQKGDLHDPEGQMLASMLIAQAKNADDQPIYGAWLTGSIWFFTILEGTNYHISSAFDATSKEDLLQIIFILRALKSLILERKK